MAGSRRAGTSRRQKHGAASCRREISRRGTSSARGERMKKIAILLLSLVLFSACAMSGAQSNDVTLNAARTGQQVMLTLRNGSTLPIGYNLCSSGLQRRAGAAWEP